MTYFDDAWQDAGIGGDPRQTFLTPACLTFDNLADFGLLFDWETAQNWGAPQLQTTLACQPEQLKQHFKLQNISPDHACYSPAKISGVARV